MPDTRQRGPLPSARPQHSAKGLFAECQVKRSVNIFFKDGNGVGGVGGQLTGILPSALFAECCARQRVPLPSGVLCRAPGTLRHSAKPLFAECNSLLSATLDKEWICRVPYFRHSAKHAALDKFCFSRSECEKSYAWIVEKDQTRQEAAADKLKGA